MAGEITVVGGSLADLDALAWITTTSPTPPTTSPNGIRIAFGQNAYSTDPTWTWLNDPKFANQAYNPLTPFNSRVVAGWSTDRGRAYELDKTQTGTATLTVYDTTGYMDPTNRSSPLYGKVFPNLRARINAQNPSSGAYSDIFTGFVESYRWKFSSQIENMMIITISLVDGFELLTRGEIQPGPSGTTIFLGDSASTACQTRLDAIADLANWPTGAEWRNFNTGNCKLQKTIYNPQTSFLSAMQDVADAEFPGVANLFCRRSGQIAFLGRYPRFQPTNYPDDVQFWQAADRNGQAPADGAAFISDIEWELDSKNLINASLCYPAGIAQADIEGQVVTDPASITRYGIRTFSMPDLINDGQNLGGGFSAQPALTANPATKIFSTYYVDCYSQPVLRISSLTFKTRPRGDSQTWALMLGVEIGDILTVFTSNPGGGGFSKETFGEGVVSQFFVEGIHNSVTAPLDGNLWEWTMTLDVSPRAWFPNNYPIGGVA